MISKDIDKCPEPLVSFVKYVIQLPENYKGFTSKNKHKFLNSFALIIMHEPVYVLLNLKNKQLLKHSY